MDTRSGVDAEALRWGMRKLAVAFPASFPDEARAEGLVALWRELLDAHPWVTEPVFRRGVTRIAWEHKGPFLPPPAVALDYLHAAVNEVRRETEKALPPPPDPAGPDDPAQISAKQAARAHLARLGLARVGGFSERVGAAPLRKRGPEPLTQEEVAAAYERRGLKE